MGSEMCRAGCGNQKQCNDCDFCDECCECYPTIICRSRQPNAHGTDTWYIEEKVD